MWTITRLSLIYSKEFRLNAIGALIILIVLPVLIGLAMIMISPPTSPEDVYRIITASIVVPSLSIGLANLASTLVGVKRSDADWIMALPITPWMWTIGFILPQILISLVSSIIVAVIMSTLLNLDIHVSWQLLISIVLCPLSLIWLGCVVANIAKEDGSLAGSLSQVVTLLILFGTPIYYPPERMPIYLREVMNFLPTTLAADTIRMSLSSNMPISFIPNQILLLLLYTLFSIILINKIIPWSKR